MQTNVTDLSFVPLEGAHGHVDILAIWKEDSANPVTQVFSEFLRVGREGSENAV